MDRKTGSWWRQGWWEVSERGILIPHCSSLTISILLSIWFYRLVQLFCGIPPPRKSCLIWSFTPFRLQCGCTFGMHRHLPHYAGYRPDVEFPQARRAWFINRCLLILRQVVSKGWCRWRQMSYWGLPSSSHLFSSLLPFHLVLADLEGRHQHHSNLSRLIASRLNLCSYAMLPSLFVVPSSHSARPRIVIRFSTNLLIRNHHTAILLANTGSNAGDSCQRIECCVFSCVLQR